MRPPKPSPFFQPAQFSHVRRGLNSPTRRALAWLAILALIAVAAAGTIYFTMPREAPAWKVARSADEPAVKARAATTEEGTADLEIQKDKQVRRLRVRKVGEQMVIEDVTPQEQKPPKKPWWKR
ncbi:MAG: hypothetical protein ABFE07_14850 [Armatimonadia bacterium]